ncbi:MAG: molecular chaperone DnaJ [Bdellovibrionales bacterium]|nr:molecular chaperone DnaJ [Bdellovibrionales bacterium]
MSKRDCYEVLGVQKSASSDDIKRAYRKAAMKYHPDRNPGDKVAEDKFKEATEAYQILSDKDNRAKYDQFGHAAFEGPGGGGFGGGDFTGFEDLFGDIFSSFFGGQSPFGSRSRGRAGRDLQYDLQVEFKEAVFGVEKEITIQREQQCETCSGSGAAKGSEPESCQQCGGRGQVAMQQGFFTISRTCPVCNGVGKIVRNPCSDCSGRGTRPVQNKLSVKVPAGIDHGQRLKLRGEGEPGSAGGPAGDLYVQVLVKDHEIFHRQDYDLICEVPINFAAAALGADVEVPTLEGKAKVKVAAGTPSGKVFRLRGKGVPVLGSERRGDLHVRMNVHVPTKLSAEQKELLEKLRELDGDIPREDEQGFFDKMKHLFS